LAIVQDIYPYHYFVFRPTATQAMAPHDCFLSRKEGMAVAPPTRYRFVIEGLVLWEQSGIGFNYLAAASMLPLIMDEFGIDRTTAGMLMSGPSLMMMVFMIPVSMLANRFGIKPTYGLGALLMGAGMLAPFVNDFYSLLALRIVFGIGGALVSPQSPSIVARWFPSRQLPLINGINTLMQNIAQMTALAGGAYLSQTIGWRPTLVVFGAIPFVCSLFWFVFGKEGPKGAETATSPPQFGEMLSILRQPATLLLGILLMGQWGQNVALSTWLPVFYNRVMGFSLSAAGSMVALIPLFGILGAFLGGVLPVRVGLRRPFFIVPGVLLVGLVFLTFSVPNEAIIVVSIAAIGICSRIFQPSAMTLPSELPGKKPKEALVTLAAAYSLGNVGSVVAPLVVGFLADQTSSYTPGLTMAAFLSLGLVVCGYLLPETGPRASRAKLQTEAAK
jgi:ACS family glucarate transporter-like MFS transporter